MPTLKTLVSFTGTNGSQPRAGLTIDATGDLFGTTASGGTPGNGTVFEVANTAQGYAITPTILVNFDITNGSLPSAGLLIDAAGNLFGTTQNGGSSGGGTVFELAKSGGSYILNTLVSFAGTNGSYPTSAGVIADAAGNLFGTTAGGPVNLGGGTVFEVAKTGSGYASAPTVLVGFSGHPDGFEPTAGLVADAAGDLFGTTYLGGVENSGTVFEVAKTGGGYASTATILVNFNFANGAGPDAGLIIDKAGDLFGTTQLGGANGFGTVFELVNNSGSYTLTTLVSFNGADGGGPLAGLIADAAGNLFGTTAAGGASGEGTVFEIAKTAGGYASTPTTVVSFGVDGITPEAGLIADAAGNLFGTTTGGGIGHGTVFEVTDSGFQVTCYVLGTRIATPTGERGIELLAPGDLVLTASGEARPVAWIGHRRIDCLWHPDPCKIRPVRVRAGAVSDGVPHRDLWLSPDHAVFVDDLLIPIRRLMNGSSIAQVETDDVSYFHLELDRHDIVLAEGLPAETYLDTGNRGMFANGGAALVLHPELIEASGQVRREAGSCAPLATRTDQVEPVWRRLAMRAIALCGTASLPASITGPQLRLSAGGREIKPVVATDDRYVFVPPPATDAVSIVSRAGAPADLRPWLDDRRRLGVSVRSIVLHGERGVSEIPTDHPSLTDGWHDVEREGERQCRWTNGRARLPVPAGTHMIELHLAGSAEYRMEAAAGARELAA